MLCELSCRLDMPGINGVASACSSNFEAIDCREAWAHPSRRSSSGRGRSEPEVSSKGRSACQTVIQVMRQLPESCLCEGSTPWRRHLPSLLSIKIFQISPREQSHLQSLRLVKIAPMPMHCFLLKPLQGPMRRPPKMAALPKTSGLTRTISGLRKLTVSKSRFYIMCCRSCWCRDHLRQ